MTDIKTDIDIWHLFKKGDMVAYGKLYECYVDELFSFGMRFTQNQDLILDCIQETFIKLYHNRLSLGEPNNVKAYLLLALKHSIFNVFRDNKKMLLMDRSEPEFYLEYSVEDEIIRDEREIEKRNLMLDILESLTPKQKEVLDYRYIKGFSISEISELMGMNYQSVQNLLQRSIGQARKKIKNGLKNEEWIFKSTKI